MAAGPASRRLLSYPPPASKSASLNRPDNWAAAPAASKSTITRSTTANTFWSAPTVLRLLHNVGADGERLLRRIPLELSFPGAGFQMKLPRLPAPLNLAFGLLGASGCSLAEKFAAVRFMRALQESHFRFANDCTVAELLDRHQQHGVLRHCLWQSLCLAALNTAPEKASAQLFANTLRDSIGGARSDTDLLLPAADLSRIFPDAAANFIKAHQGKIHLSTRIDDIDPRREIHGERFDHVVLAVAEVIR